MAIPRHGAGTEAGKQHSLAGVVNLGNEDAHGLAILDAQVLTLV